MDKYVYVKSLEKPLDKNQKPYLKITDQENTVFNLFKMDATIEVGKSYLFTYTMNGNYPDVTKITPLVNVFQQKALKEISSRNDYKRDIFMAVSYSKDLLIAGKIEPTELFTFADKIYCEVNAMVDKYLPKEGD